MRVVWITGARGFLGRNLARWLSQRGARVGGVGHGAWSDQEAAQWGLASWCNGSIVPSNLRQLMERVGRPEVVYHLAGGASVTSALTTPLEDFARTVSTSAELLEWVRCELPKARVVAVSSAAVYGDQRVGPIEESVPTAPVSPYGFHKLMMEQAFRSYSASYHLNTVVARVFSVYGAGLKKQLLWDLCSKLGGRAGPIELEGTGDELRDWIDVRDLVRALELVASLAATTTPILNVGTGVGTSVRTIAETVASVWAHASSTRILFNGRTRAGDPFSLVSSQTQLDALGFAAQIPIESGLRDYVDWYRREREGLA